MNQRWRRRIALMLAMSLSTLSISLAAAPEVTVDETAYITLDCYGQQTDASIVKAVDLNGNSAFTDYGRYETVVNMSTTDQPIITDEGVEWQLDNPSARRFYYQVHTQDGYVDIPWSVDVSYSLNGVPAAPEELAGKAGLVAIDVVVTPNNLVDDYYKNNFVLLCGALSDSGSDYSFRADGAQLQSFGRYRLAVFMAMPREEATFHLEIGTDAFDFNGLIFASMPVTLAQAEDIAGIAQDREDIETLWNATDSMLDDVLSMMTSMTAGTAQSAQGLRELETAWQVADGHSESIGDKVDSTLFAMKQLRNHLEDLADIMDDSGLLDSIGKIEDNLDDMLTMVGKLGAAAQRIEGYTAEAEELLQQLQIAATPQEQLALMAQLREVMGGLNRELDTLASLLEDADSVAQIAQLQAGLKQLDDAIGAGQVGDPAAVAALVQALMDAAKEVSAAVDAELADAKKNISNIESLMPSGDISADLSDMTSDMNLLNNEIAMVLDSTARTVGKAQVLMSEINSTMDQAYDHLNTGMNNTLGGTAQLLEDLTVALQRTQNIQYNKNQISSLISKDWDKLEEDLGVLDMDPSARKPSFTSARNPEPVSLQIVMRTESITLPDPQKSDVDELGDDKTVTQRLGDVFISIGNAIKGLFD